jgi:hypothetical protein
MADQLIPYLLDMYRDTLTYEPPGGTDQYGDPAPYGDPQVITCRLIGRNRMARDATGTEKLSTLQAEIAGHFGLNPEGRFTMPIRFNGIRPKAIAIESVPDENGPHHETVFFP